MLCSVWSYSSPDIAHFTCFFFLSAWSQLCGIDPDVCVEGPTFDGSHANPCLARLDAHRVFVIGGFRSNDTTLFDWSKVRVELRAQMSYQRYQPACGVADWKGK